MQSHILPTADLACIYRFAVLLTGAPEPAQAAVLDTFADAGEKIHHFRNGKSSIAWLIAKLRNRLLKQGAPATAAAPQDATKTPGDELSPGAFELADRFSKIPEPGRSALALLYLDHFTAAEIAQILQLTPDELSATVDSARSLLRQMEGVQKAATVIAEQQEQREREA